MVFLGTSVVSGTATAEVVPPDPKPPTLLMPFWTAPTVSCYPKNLPWVTIRWKRLLCWARSPQPWNRHAGESELEKCIERLRLEAKFVPRTLSHLR